MGLGTLFLRFLRFGALAWGGPTAQIAMLRRELVEEERWVEPERFNRVLAVYQALPGPEAFELCCYFGMLRRGRPGAIVAGLGFLLPGLVLMLAASWLYVRYGLESGDAKAAMASATVAVAALISNATMRLWKHTVTSAWLAGCAAAAAISVEFSAPFWLALLGCAVAGVLRSFSARATWAVLVGVGVLCFLWPMVSRELLYSVPTHPNTGPAIITPAVRGSRFFDAPLVDQAITGLKAGLLTFGGAYTAIPLVDADTRLWLVDGEVGHALAVGAVLPAPLVMFCTMVGYLRGGWGGAFVMTAGVFLPAFSFTLIGHRFIEKLVDSPRWHNALDAVAAGVIGMLAIFAFRSVQGAVDTREAMALFVLAWLVIHVSKRAWTVPAVVLGSVALGIWGHSLQQG